MLLNMLWYIAGTPCVKERKDVNADRCALTIAVADYIGGVVFKWQMVVRGHNFQRNHPCLPSVYRDKRKRTKFDPTKFSVIICLNNCKCRISCSDYRCLSGSGICLRFVWVYLLRRGTYVHISPCFGFLSFFCFFHVLFARLCFHLCASFFSLSMHVGCWCAYGLLFSIQ